jgi:hypothetical protein
MAQYVWQLDNTIASSHWLETKGKKKKSIEGCGMHAPHNAHRDSGSRREEQKKVPEGVEMKALDRWIDGFTPLSPY